MLSILLSFISVVLLDSVVAFVWRINAEHIENYYVEYLAHHYTEYENQNEQNNVLLTSKLANSAAANNHYYLYTRNNPSTPDVLLMNDISSINSSHYNPSLSTVIVVHGWGGDVSSEINPAVRDAFLAKGPVNVIVLDWNQVAKQNYLTAVRDVPTVGRNLGRFLEYLESSTGASFSRMHLVGFSLGAHVVGNAGRVLNGRVARITGLDPAGPLWTLNSNRLKSTDAVYVEAIHTSRGGLGINLNVGNVDFYPNGGSIQPGCLNLPCNHNRSWQLFVSSVANNNLRGRRCDNVLQATFNNCHGESYTFGTDDLQKHGAGIYAFSTNATYPY